MHSDIHLTLHELRAGELRAAAAGQVPREPLRVRLGRTLVELGLRMLDQPTGPVRRSTRIA